MPSDRDELLDRVYKRATGLWWQRRFAPIAAAAVVLVVAIGVPVLRAGHGEHRTTLAATDKTTTTGDFGSSETGDDATTTTTAAAGDTTPVVSTVLPRGTTTTTARSTAPDRCRNSNNGDESCGPFHWANDPGPNAPLSFEISYAPAHPVAGQEVTFTVHVVDPDATPITDCGAMFEGGREGANDGCTHTLECALHYGSWDVPPRQRGEATFTYKHVYTAAGTYNATFYAESNSQASGGSCARQPNPYASSGSETKGLMVS